MKKIIYLIALILFVGSIAYSIIVSSEVDQLSCTLPTCTPIDHSDLPDLLITKN